VELVASPENLGAIGRNVGVARVDTPYVAFCDDDTWWGPRLAAHRGRRVRRHPRWRW
jgi:GT2 family glycosyltransferase